MTEKTRAQTENSKRWYVVAHNPTAGKAKRVWTLSQNPNETGWTTDSGFDGYGLTYRQARYLADAANEYSYAQKNTR